MLYFLNVNTRSDRTLFRTVLESNVELHKIKGTYINYCTIPDKPCERYFDLLVQICINSDALIIVPLEEEEDTKLVNKVSIYSKLCFSSKILGIGYI
jgi:hypothetical protein